MKAVIDWLIRSPQAGADGIMVWNGEPVSHAATGAPTDTSQLERGGHTQPEDISVTKELFSHTGPGGDRGFQAPSYEVEDSESFVGSGGAPVAGDAGHEGPSTLLNFIHDGAPEASGVESMTLNFEHNVIGEDGVDHHDAVHDVHHDANFDHGHHGLADHHIDVDL